jgi:hypothetical protein
MGFFDDIVPPDSASSYFATPPGVPRITVRPKGVELPPGPGNAQIPADADEKDNAPPARSGGFFDDIVPPAGPGPEPRAQADASDETENVPRARSGGFFDDIVPPAIALASGMAASSGGQFAAPLPDGRNFRVAREGISPPAGFADRLAAMWENPPKDRLSLIGLIKSAYEGATLPGDVLSGKTPIIGPDGHTSDEVISRAKDLAQVYPLSGAPGGFFGRAIKDRAANPLLTTERALSDEAAAAPRGTIAPTVPPATSRGAIPREPPPPARPPDKAAAQSDRMTSEARESGPFDSRVHRADATTPGGRVAAESAPNIVYRGLTDADAVALRSGQGLTAKAPNGTWTAAEHVANSGPGKAAANSPWISTSRLPDVARAYDRGHGVAAIDLNRVASPQVEVWRTAPRLNGEPGLPYHRSIWGQEVTIHRTIPNEAITWPR